MRTTSFVTRQGILLLIALTVTYIGIPIPVIASDTPSVEITLRQAMTESLEFNRQLEIQRATIAEERSGVKVEQGEFVSRFDINSTMVTERRDRFTLNNIADRRTESYNAAVERQLDNGDRVSVNLNHGYEDETAFIPRNNVQEYQSSVSLRYVKPIFQGAGRDVTLSDVRQAKIRLSLEKQRFNDERAQVLFRVFEGYYNLYRTRRELKIQREILGYSDRILEIVRKKVNKRTLPVNALTQVKAFHLTQRNQITTLQNQLRQRQYELMNRIYTDPKISRAVDISPVTSPRRFLDTGGLRPETDTLSRVRKQDIELIRLRHEKRILGQAKIEAQNEILPELTLTSEAGIDGYDSTERDDSFRNISTDNYHVEIQANLSFPWAEQTARNRLKSINQRIRQVELRTKNRINTLKQTVSELYDDLNTVRQQLRQTREISRLSEKNLNQEIKRLVAGKSTVLDTIQFQRNFSEARLNLLEQRIRYTQLRGTYRLLRREMTEILSDLYANTS